MNDEVRTVRWIHSILHGLSGLDQNKGVDILHACGEACSKSSELLEGVNEIRRNCRETGDLDLLFTAFKKQYYNTSRFTKEGDIITLVFEECTCPMVKKGVRNPYLCHCTVGYSRHLFETLLGRPVEVKLVKSILNGDPICHQEILIQAAIPMKP